MKHILLTTIAAVVLVGCGPSEADRALRIAASVGNIEAVKQHLAAGANVNAKDDDGWTPLHGAAYEDQKEIAELLIAKGADVNAKDDGSWTSLHSAAWHGHKEIVELLITNGADVNVTSELGTPLDRAVFHNHPETAELLRKHGGKTKKELEAAGK